jgi:hypothetical protein
MLVNEFCYWFLYKTTNYYGHDFLQNTYAALMPTSIILTSLASSYVTLKLKRSCLKLPSRILVKVY